MINIRCHPERSERALRQQGEGPLLSLSYCLLETVMPCPLNEDSSAIAFASRRTLPRLAQGMESRDFPEFPEFPKAFCGSFVIGVCSTH